MWLSVFKVKREDHAIDNSYNEFPEPKTLRNKKTIISVRQMQAEITKVT